MLYMSLFVILTGRLQKIRYEQPCSCQYWSHGADGTAMKSHSCEQYVEIMKDHL